MTAKAELVQCNKGKQCGEEGCPHHGQHEENFRCAMPDCLWTDRSGEAAECVAVPGEEGERGS